MRVEAALGLGGNLGNPVAAFAEALSRLRDHAAVTLRAVSPVYRTPPWGRLDQPDFLNAAALVETSLSPRALLDLCLSLERAAGRERTERWGPRTLDIDILAYGDLRIEEPGLTVPHPRLTERAFALLPLAAIAPELIVGRRTIADRARMVEAEGIAADPEAGIRLAAMLAN